MMKRNRAFTLIELMITITVMGILMAVAIPAYEEYTRRAHYVEVIQASAPYKTAVSLCVHRTGGLQRCSNGRNGVPSIKQPVGQVQSIKVSSQGVITVVPQAINNIHSDETYVLTPHFHNGSLTWNISGGCLAQGLC